MKRLLFLFLLLPFLLKADLTQKPIAVVIPSYNNIDVCKRNLDSVVTQDYTNWCAIYIDDCSTDGTGNAVINYIKEHNLENRIIFIRNQKNVGPLANVYKAVHSCKDNAIIVILDGDDWFAGPQTLATINQKYADPDVWLTYGSYKEYPGSGIGSWREYPKKIIENNLFRKYYWLASHPRTFYAWLFKKIRKEDLQVDGEFFRACTDIAAMFPMLEMAGKHSKHLKDVLYVYNMDNPINIYKKKFDTIKANDKILRNRKPYKCLESRPIMVQPQAN